jgi:hypothetical protein
VQPDGFCEVTDIVLDAETEEVSLAQQQGGFPRGGQDASTRRRIAAAANPQWTVVLADDSAHFTPSVGPHPKYDTRRLVCRGDLTASSDSDDPSHSDRSFSKEFASLGISHPLRIAERFVGGYSPLDDWGSASDPNFDKLKRREPTCRTST